MVVTSLPFPQGKVNQVGVIPVDARSFVVYRQGRMSELPVRDELGRLVPGHKLPNTRMKGARGIAARIAQLTNNMQDLADWCFALWSDVDAPLEWRWKAFEWLANRGAGMQPSAQVLNVTNVTNAQDLSKLSTEELAEIDATFRKAHARTLGDGK